MLESTKVLKEIQEIQEKNKVLCHLLVSILLWSIIKDIRNNFGDPFYLSLTSSQHNSFFSVASIYLSKIPGLGLFSSFVVYLSYFFSVLGLLFLFSGPVALWFSSFKKRKFRLKPFFIGIGLSSILNTFFSGAIGVKILSDKIYGLDFFVRESQLNLSSLTIQFGFFLLAGVIVFLILSLRNKNESFRTSSESEVSFFRHAIIVFVQVFLVAYTFTFFYSLAGYFFKVLKFLVLSSSYFLAVLFLLFLVINFLFYIFGSVFFVEDVYNNEHLINFG